MNQPSLVDITVGDDEKFTICGDVHGQFYDLMNIFELNGLPSPTNPYVSLCALRKYAIWYFTSFAWLQTAILMSLYFAVRCFANILKHVVLQR